MLIVCELFSQFGSAFICLQPDNIGFDEDGGVLKLFDFGLAKELKPGMENAKGTYNLTGNTGRYVDYESVLFVSPIRRLMVCSLFVRQPTIHGAGDCQGTALQSQSGRVFFWHSIVGIVQCGKAILWLQQWKTHAAGGNRRRAPQNGLESHGILASQFAAFDYQMLVDHA